MIKIVMRLGVLLSLGVIVYCGIYWFPESEEAPGDSGNVYDYNELAEEENINWGYMLIENEQTMAEVKPEPKKEKPVAVKKVENKKVKIDREKLKDYDFLCKHFYQIDSTTSISKKQLDASKFLKMDMSLDKKQKGPQILIYHTHSQEGYSDSKEGKASESVVRVGDQLTELLEKKGYKVLHHTGKYDVGDRNHAYSNALPALQKVLADNPSIQVVIDLHRDGVADTTRLVTEINGKKMAQIMFFNGLSYTNKLGDIKYLNNPYKEKNLALSFQLQLAAEENYPGLTRRIYLKGYRYNMHLCPKSILVEVGAQTNTLQEALNAMEPLSDILSKVLK